MSHKIYFSYCFDDELDRVYECFKNFYLYTEMTLSSLLTNAKKIKGDSFDEEGAIMEIIVKNNFYFRVTVKNVSSSPLYKYFKHKLTYLDKNQMETYVKVKFYWDSCEKKTFIFYEYDFNDKLFSLLKDLMTDKNFNDVCDNIKEYLKKNFNGLEISKGIFINASLQKVWNYINNWNNINEIFINKINFTSEIKGNIERLDSIINFYKLDKKYLVSSLILRKLFMSENKIELFYENLNKKLLLPNLYIEFCLTKISEETCFLDILISPNEHLSLEVKSLFSEDFLKCLSSIKDHFKAKKKTDY